MTPGVLYIITPLMRRGSLDKFMYEERSHFPVFRRAHVLWQVAMGLEYLHVRPSPSSLMVALTLLPSCLGRA